jgi:CubicO group peptidase (beta-lactamase class C family)
VPRDEANASFWNRLDTIGADPLSPALSWYQPLATLQGAPGPFIPLAHEGDRSFSPQTIDEVTSFADATKGDALLVARDGVLQIEHYTPGGSDTPTHAFSAHSMSRVLGAVAIGILIDRGLISSVDVPASTYLPEWRTIRQLLTMSSGIQSKFSTDPASPYMQSYYGADVERIVADAPLVAEPGKVFFYDNHNNHAISLIIERVAKTPYISFVSRNIWRPLGASDATMMLDHPGGRVMAYCCAIVTPRDWLRVGEMLRMGGVWKNRRIVSAAWVSQMRQPSAANPNFGFQLFLGSAWMNPEINRQFAKQQPTLEPVHSKDAFYVSGAGDINLMVIPDQKLTILRTGRASPLWLFHVIPNVLIDSLSKAPVAGAWSSLFAYRMGLPSMGDNPTLATSGMSYWPTARVEGVSSPAPLPRRPLSCAQTEAFHAIDAKLAEKPDYAVIVYQDGAIVHEHYAGGITPDTRAEPASMHKSVMALLVGQAVTQGKINSIDAPVSTWLPEWADDPRGRITLRNLLQMSSGLKPVPFDLSPTGKTNQFLKGSDLERQVLDLEYKEKPGTTFEYFSQVSELIAVILQRATGAPYATYLSQSLWRPLGASDAYVALDKPGGIPHTPASLLAKPEDWVRVGALILNDGVVDGRRLVSSNWLKEMSAPSPANPNYGFQIWRASPYNANRAYSSSAPVFTAKATKPFIADDMLYFDGAVGRRVYISNHYRLVIVRLGDTDLSWDDSWLPNAVVSALEDCPTAH